MNRNGRSEWDHFCCERLDASLKARKSVLLYVPNFREYGLRVLDGGSSFIVLSFCPWCGFKCPKRLRHRWFEELERLGFELPDPAIPDKYRTAEWWQESAVEDDTGDEPVTAHADVGDVVDRPSTPGNQTGQGMLAPCCELMTIYLGSEDGEIPIRYCEDRGEYAFFLRYRPPSFVRVEYCPWCGTRLSKESSGDDDVQLPPGKSSGPNRGGGIGSSDSPDQGGPPR